MSKLSPKDNKNSTATIDASWTIDTIFTEFSHCAARLAQALTKRGLGCVGCHAASWETIEAGMLSHGKTASEITELLAELNAIAQEEIDTTTITLTPFAAQKVRQFAISDGKEGWGLRFEDRAGGCGGFEYILDFQENPLEGEMTFESEGIRLFVKQTSLTRLIGSHIDFQDSMQGAGFKISNPNAKSACSCGTSHNY